LNDILTFANIGLIITLIITLVFNILNFRQAERVRRQRATLEHLNIFQSETFARMEALFNKLPDNLDLSQLGKLDSDSMTALQFIGRHLESLGIAVSLRLLDIEVVERSLGDNVILYWKKIQPLATEMRKSTTTQDFAKWTEWLSNKIESNQNKRLKL
jgi:hypothetical protein